MTSVQQDLNNLDLSQLEAKLQALSNPSTPAHQRAQVDKDLTELRNNPASYKYIPSLLQNQNSSLNVKFFALSVLQETVKFRWNALPREEKDGLKNFIVQQVLQLASNSNASNFNTSQQKIFLNKFNVVLVDVLKQDWPDNWPDFLPDIINSSTTSESLCLNNLSILKLLTEEIFSFSKDSLTQQRTKFLKQELISQFQRIVELIAMILSQSGNQELLSVALQTLTNFVEWIPIDFIFTSKLHESVVSYLNSPSQIYAISCLREICSLNLNNVQQESNKLNYLRIVMNLFQAVVQNISQTKHASQKFKQECAMFISAVLNLYFNELESNNVQELFVSLDILLEITACDQKEEKELFIICVEFFNTFSNQLYKRTKSALFNNSQPNPAVYKAHLSKLRQILIPRMSKPSEVLIVEDEDGSIIRETNSNTEDLTTYKLLRETLVYLTHLDPLDTEQIMLRILTGQFAEGGFSWNGLNTLCWAVGSISGSMTEDSEKSFLVTVIKDLLSLVEVKKGKDNKAVVASNIMYVVGQYPRFLKQHWKFLKTVVNKLFEFMHELHPGVQDMACDTFLTIAKSCRTQFVTMQVGESDPFISTLINKLAEITSQLQPHQTVTFFQSCASILCAPELGNQVEQYLARLMQTPNTEFEKLLSEATQLTSIDVVKAIVFILQVNVRVCETLKANYSAQFCKIFLSLTNLYTSYTHFQNSTQHNPHDFLFKSIRSLKSKIITLCSLFVQYGNPQKFVVEAINVFSTPLMEDYAKSKPEEKLSSTLGFFSTVLDSSNGQIDGIIPALFNSVVQECLKLITNNFTDFPEHRINYYSLIRSLIFNGNNFQKLFQDVKQVDLTVNSILWAIKHTDRRISEKGLEILEKLLFNVQSIPSNDIRGSFWGKFYLPILKDLLEVLTDRLHKSSFKMHCVILKHLILGVQTGQIQAISKPELENNICGLMASEFPDVGKGVIQTFVSQMFDLSQAGQEEFKEHMRDFLIKLKEFSKDGDDNQKLFLDEEEQRKKQEMMEKAKVPGLLSQKDQDDLADL
eukprot:snap_masked-scaffold_23-processed-gene-3.12-mRNA-1 protein AED:0.00 eAED:0.01 QI:0/-1/0/1/-1/1/1/0/1034